MSFYSREIIRRVREEQDRRETSPEVPATSLASIPCDAPMDDSTITVWTGERWVDYERWKATHPVPENDGPVEQQPAVPENADCVAGDCGSRRIWLVRGGERWLIFVGSRRPAKRRKNFGSPFLSHAIRTAEAWYGAPRDGWRPEKRGNEEGLQEAASVPPQNSDVAEGPRQ